jgi:hypothetical protein
MCALQKLSELTEVPGADAGGPEGDGGPVGEGEDGEAAAKMLSAMLRFVVVEGRGLTNMDAFSQQDPYVKLMVVDGAGALLASGQTGVIRRGGTDPKVRREGGVGGNAYSPLCCTAGPCLAVLDRALLRNATLRLLCAAGPCARALLCVGHQWTTAHRNVQTLRFRVARGLAVRLVVEVWDEDVGSTDDLVGTTEARPCSYVGRTGWHGSRHCCTALPCQSRVCFHRSSTHTRTRPTPPPDFLCSLPGLLHTASTLSPPLPSPPRLTSRWT